MANLLNYFRRCWNYIIHHRWSKDILRANLFYIFLLANEPLPLLQAQPRHLRSPSPSKITPDERLSRLKLNKIIRPRHFSVSWPYFYYLTFPVIP